MELIITVRMVDGCNVGLEPSGRELLVIGQGHLRRAQPPILADTFTGGPRFSAAVYEIKGGKVQLN